MPQQTAHLEHLQEQMSNLQEVVEGLHDVRISAVGVFKIQAAVLLDVKALVFDVATHPPSLVGNGANIFGVEPKVRHPGEGLISGRATFLTNQSMDQVKAALVVGVFQIIDPTKNLFGFIWQMNDQSIFWQQFEQALDLPPERRGPSLFKGQDIGPVVVSANAKNWTAAVQRISTDAKACLRKLFFQVLSQASKGFE